MDTRPNIDIVQDEVIEKADPRMDLIDRLMGRLDERMLSILIARWRKSVWQDAQDLITASENNAEPRRLLIEERALKRAQVISLG